MTIPEWFCPVICAGLDIKELIPNKPLNNKHKLIKNKNKVKENKQFRFKEDETVEFNNFEENTAANFNTQISESINDGDDIYD